MDTTWQSQQSSCACILWILQRTTFGTMTFLRANRLTCPFLHWMSYFWGACEGLLCSEEEWRPYFISYHDKVSIQWTKVPSDCATAEKYFYFWRSFLLLSKLNIDEAAGNLLLFLHVHMGFPSLFLCSIYQFIPLARIFETRTRLKLSQFMIKCLKTKVDFLGLNLYIKWKRWNRVYI